MSLYGAPTGGGHRQACRWRPSGEQTIRPRPRASDGLADVLTPGSAIHRVGLVNPFAAALWRLGEFTREDRPPRSSTQRQTSSPPSRFTMRSLSEVEKNPAAAHCSAPRAPVGSGTGPVARRWLVHSREAGALHANPTILAKPSPSLRQRRTTSATASTRCSLAVPSEVSPHIPVWFSRRDVLGVGTGL
jgi:hypothetical protein